MWGKLIIRNLLHDFKRTVVSIICLGVSVLLIFVTMASFSSYQHMRRLDAYEHYGKYHLELRDISAEEVIKIRELLGDQVEFEEVSNQERVEKKTLRIRLKTCTEEELSAVMSRVSATLGIPLESFLDIDKISESEDGPLYILNSGLIRVEIYGEGSVEDRDIGILLIGILILLILSALLLSIFVFRALFHARRGQWGLLKSMGISDGWILSAHTMESLVLAGIGCGTGTLSGYGITHLIFWVLQKIRRIPLAHFEIRIDGKLILLLFLFCMVGFGSTALISILRRVGSDPVEMLREIPDRRRFHIPGSRNSRKLTLRYFRRDKKNHERVCSFLLMFLIGVSVLLIFYVNRYIEYRESHRERFSSEFEIIADKDELSDKLREVLPTEWVQDYIAIIDTTRVFILSEDMFRTEVDIKNLRTEDGIYFEIIGVDRDSYEATFESDISYEKMLSSDGAVLVGYSDNPVESILTMLPDHLDYTERNDDYIHSEGGSISIVGSARFRTGNSTDALRLVLPAEKMKEKFDYTIFLARINATPGEETELAEALNSLSERYRFTLNDHVSEYIAQDDTHNMIRFMSYGILCFVLVMHTMILLYQALLVFVRRRRTLRLLGIMGQGKWRLALWAGISELPEPLLASILAVFGAKIVVQNKLPMDVRMVLRGGDLPESWFIPCFLLGILMIITFFTKSIRTSGDNTGDL